MNLRRNFNNFRGRLLCWSGPIPIFKRFLDRSEKKGFALVVTLGALALVSLITVAFMTSSRIDLVSSKFYSRGVETRMLADSAINIAMLQIQQGAKSRDASSHPMTWTSQPGLIRVFDEKGDAVSAYKLYSSNKMVVKGALKPTEDVPSGGWEKQPALYTDLNQPVYRGIKSPRYPILNPPSDVVGYSILKDVKSNPSSFSKPVMPVKWMYVLKDGRIVAPSEGSSKVSVEGASASNPISGRIAFWTDDETCKININTAAGDSWNGTDFGSYWDLPRVYNTEDRMLADAQPQAREYQRYPGHPATVYLGAAFPNLKREDLYRLVPRIQEGGSDGGTKKGLLANGLEPDPKAGVVTDNGRLYASVDELMFQATNRQPEKSLDREALEKTRFFLTARSRSPEVNLFGLPRIAIWPIHSDLAANPTNSKYTTPFDRLIAFCSSLKTSTGVKPFYIQRKDSVSATNDYNNIARNQTLYQYLQEMTSKAVPGFGGNFLSKYSFPSERDQILTEIVDYIRCTNLFDDVLVKQNKPNANYPHSGYPTSVGGVNYTYTSRRADISTTDPGHGQAIPLVIGNTKGFGRIYTVSEAGFIFICTGNGDTNNDTNATNQALCTDSNVLANKTLNGTLLTETERRIEAMFMLELFSPSQGYPMLNSDMQIQVTGLDQFKIDTVPLQFPASGVVQHRGQVAVFHGRAFGGLGGIRYLISGDPEPEGGNNLTGVNRHRAPARGGFMPADAGWNASNSYPFLSVPITVTYRYPSDPPSAKTTMELTGTDADGGGTITVGLYAGRVGAPGSVTSPLIQSFSIKMPKGTFPIPKLVNNGVGTTSAKMWWTFARDGCGLNNEGRMYHVSKNPGDANSVNVGAIFRTEDVVRTVAPSHGDYRLLTASATIPDTIFTPHSKYSDPTETHAHYLKEGNKGDVFIKYDTTGSYIPGMKYFKEIYPDAPGLIAAASTGDWDNGIADTGDGTFINLADAGTQYRALDAAGNPSVPYYGSVESASGPGFFSPNREVPSPGMFGSLSTGVKEGVPYRTLLFRPDPAHPSYSKTIPDHLMMDLFWMPIVEPYAISETLSTAGKVNLNYQMIPFTHIERSTALHAAMRGERVLAVPETQNVKGAQYKKQPNAMLNNLRKKILMGESSTSGTGTLSQWMQRFEDGAAGYVFKSASEICDLYLVPEDGVINQMAAYWGARRLTGDSSRERPYTNLYQKLTVKSNTFTVHYRVQKLQKIKTDPNQGQWEEGKDLVVGERRGSAIIERYLDPETKMPDFATDTTASVDDYYQWRILELKEFNE